MIRTIIERPIYLQKLKDYTNTDIIRVITGVRRCGKSSLLVMYKAWLEEEFGITIPAASLREIRTAGDLCRLVGGILD